MERNGRLLTQAGRLSLTKSVLSSQPVYLLTVLKTYKETLQKIDKLRKQSSGRPTTITGSET